MAGFDSPITGWVYAPTDNVGLAIAGRNNLRRIHRFLAKV
jgi:hypothetical protein